MGDVLRRSALAQDDKTRGCRPRGIVVMEAAAPVGALYLGHDGAWPPPSILMFFRRNATGLVHSGD